MTEIEKLLRIIDLIVPEIFYENREGFKNVLKNSFLDEQNIIDKDTIENGFYGLKSYEKPQFQTLVLLDVLSEGFISKYKSEEIENLWGTLSSIMNCRNIEFLRKTIDYEIYENNSKEYDFENSSQIFRNTEYKVVRLNFMEFESLTILSEKELKLLKAETENLNIEITEMNKNVA